MSLDINRLEENREDILKAEIGSYFILIDKTSIDKWKNIRVKKDTCKQNIDYFPNNSAFNFDEEQFFKYIDLDKVSINFDGKLINLWRDFLKDWRSGKTDIQKILARGCENVNSGIDKGSPDDCNQLDSLWISNAFGSFIRKVDANDLDNKRECYKDRVKDLINKLSNNSFDYFNDGSEIVSLIRDLYANLLSDSRFPVNDVTLWDQAYMSATMFKAALAGMVLNTKESQNYISNPQSIKWQILGVQYDKLALAEKALKVPIIQWYRKTAKEVDDYIKEIIEIDYPVGNEIYRDETGIYFLISEGIKLDDIGEIKRNILNLFKEKFNDEIYPYIGFTKPSRGTMNLTALLEKAKENFLKADYSLKSNVVVKKSAIEICQICKSRLVERDDTKDDIRMCDVCKRRKEGRINTWLEQQDDETIWISELADRNSRVALVTLKFELMEWLNGDLLSSLLVRNLEINDTFNDLVNNLKKDFKQINKKLNKTVLKPYRGDIPNQSLENLVKTLLLERTIGNRWEEFIKNNLSDETAIDFDNRKINWDKFNNDDVEFLSKVILQFLLRKNPSPARLRRIWESTEEFFNEVKSDVLDNITAYRTKDSFVRKVPDFKNLKDQIKEQEYKQYFSIIDPTPISWQFVIPAEKVEEVIDKIQRLYYKNFKYVDGKLPLHIGVVVQNYKKPLYIGIKALRNIRRDIKGWREIKREGIDLLEDLSFYFDIKETNNNARDFYSLYETDNPDYDFYLLPSNKGVKKYNTIESFVIYHSTFDFEFLDTNTRRNDIYFKNGKRVVKLKQNRPYSWSEWEYFKKFRDDFKDKSNRLQTLVSLIYSKMEDWRDDEESFKKFMKSTFKKEGLDISVYGIKDYSFEEMKKFLDMFEFWHTAVKEV